jgi:hypothetical protein
MLRVVAVLLALLPSLACAQNNPAFPSRAPQPILDCNFTARVAYNTATNTLSAGPRCPPVLFNRASSKYDINCNGGVLTTFATDVPDVPACALGTGRPLGLGIEGVGLIVNSRARDLTQSAWIKHGTTAALIQTGLDGTANSASLLTASSNNGTACNGTTANALQRVISIYLKRVTGVGEPRRRELDQRYRVADLQRLHTAARRRSLFHLHQRSHLPAPGGRRRRNRGRLCQRGV